MNLPPELCAIILDLLSDVSKKMYLSICRELRETIKQYIFHDWVDHRHLAVSPCPENHASLVISYGYDEWVQGYLSIPSRIVRLRVEKFRYHHSLDMSQCKLLKELALISTGETRIKAPSWVEHLSLSVCSFPLNHDGLQGGLWSAGDKLVKVEYLSGGLWRQYGCRVPSSLKTLTALDAGGKLLTVTLPYNGPDLRVIPL